MSEDILQLDESEQAILGEEGAKDREKLRPFLKPATSKLDDIAGVIFHPFSGGRKGALQLTQNEFLNVQEHIERYLAEKGIIKVSKDVYGQPATPEQKAKLITEDMIEEQFSTLSMKAVPQALFHVYSLAFICCVDVDTLADVTVDLKTFRRAVFRWKDTLSSEQLQKVSEKAGALLKESTIGQGFEAVTHGEPDAPN